MIKTAKNALIAKTPCVTVQLLQRGISLYACGCSESAMCTYFTHSLI